MGSLQCLVGLIPALGVGVFLAPAAPAAIIHVSTGVTGNVTQIEQNQTVTVNVFASIENPSDAHDGIFTFDEDLILANVVNNQPSVLAFQSLTRPNVNDALFGGSDGTSNSLGVQSIYGGYLDDTRGIGSPALLFSLILKGIALGTDLVTPGPSTNPFGFDLLLYKSPLADISVTYDGGAVIQVVASGGGNGGNGGTGGNGGGTQVPLPPSVACGLLSALFIWPAMRQRRSR